MFAVAKCGHCGNSGTRVVEIEPRGAKFKQTATCCSSCNAILGVSGYYDEGQLLKEAEARSNALAHKVANIEHQLTQILRALQNLQR